MQHRIMNYGVQTKSDRVFPKALWQSTICTKRNRLPETDYHNLAEKAYRSGLQAVLPKKGAECIVEEEEGSHGHYSERGYGASVVPD